MLAVEVITKVRSRGVTIERDDTGNNLKLKPASALTPDLIRELRQHKPEILGLLPKPSVNEPIQTTAEVLELACRRFPGSQPFDPDEHPPPKHGFTTDRDKVLFFRGAWRKAQPRDFKVYRGEV